MTSRTLGKRYAKALIAAVTDRGESAAAVLAELERAENALGAEPKFLALLVNPKLALAERVRAFERVLEGLAPGALVRSFLLLLVRRARIPVLSDIVLEFRTLSDAQAGVIRAAATSASPLAADEIATLRALLERRFGKTVILTVQVDSALIGGLVIRVGSLSFDGSIRSQLKAIQSQLLEEVSLS